MLSQLLCLQIILQFLLCIESKAIYSNEVELDKRITNSKMKILLENYDKSNPGEMISHWKCAVPFRIYHTMLQISTYGPYYCKHDDSYWCSHESKHRVRISNWEYCLPKGSEEADPKKWKAAESCSPLFLIHNDKKGRYYYYKGCTTANAETPWCAHNIELDSENPGKSDCIDISPKWTTWTEWSECSQICNDGMMIRTRKCLTDNQESSECEGDNSENQSCNLGPCTTEAVEPETTEESGPAAGSLDDSEDIYEENDGEVSDSSEYSEMEEGGNVQAISSSNKLMTYQNIRTFGYVGRCDLLVIASLILHECKRMIG